MQFFKLIITHPVLKASDGIFYEHPKKLSYFFFAAKLLSLFFIKDP